MRIYLFLLLAFITINTIDAENKLNELTEKEAKAYFWESDNVKAKATEVPDNWKDKSAVILHKQIDIESILKSKKPGYSNYSKSLISHYRIKVQDKAAIDYYSELHFTPFRTNSGRAQTYYWGIKIEKTNGKTIEIDIDKEQVEEKNNDVSNYKVAIPDLEEGDILDVYRYYTEIKSMYETHFYEKMLLQDANPIVNFELNIQTGKDFQLGFKSNNKAPEIEVDSEKKYKYSLKEENIEESKAENWYYSFHDNPYIEFYLRQGPFESKDRFIQEYKEKYIYNQLLETYSADRNTKNEIREFERFLKRKEIQTTSKSDFLERYYYFTRHKFLNMHVIYKLNHGQSQGTSEYEDQNFLNHMIGAADKLDLKYHVLIAQPRNEGQITDALIPDYWFQVIRIETDKGDQYFYAPSNYSMYGIVPMTIEGADAHAGTSETGKYNDLELTTFKLPVSSHEDNLTDHKIIADLTAGVTEPVKVSTTMDVNGRGIFYYKDEVIDYFDFVIEENKYYDTKRWGDLDSKLDKNVRTKLEEYKTEFSKIRDEMLLNMAKNDFDTDQITLKDFELMSNGNWHKAKNLKFRYDFDVEEGLIKKAGPNYILQAGKLVGGQVEISEEEKERSENIHMPFARSFNYNIEINIPEGYSVEGIDKFNKKVENATGGLVSSGKVVGNTVELKFYKYYKNNYEKVKDWPEMIKFLDAGYQFTQEKLLLRKK